MSGIFFLFIWTAAKDKILTTYNLRHNCRLVLHV